MRNVANLFDCKFKCVTFLRLYIGCILAIVVLLAHGTSGVDRSKFKSCEQSSFCQRNRNLKPHEQQWVLDTRTVSTNTDGTLTVQITDEVSQVKLELKVYMTQNGAIRLKVDQIDATRKRFEAKEALNPSLTFKPVELTSGNQDGLVFNFGDKKRLTFNYRLVLNSKPFKAEVFNSANILILSLNSKGLMKFEPHVSSENITPEAQHFGLPVPAQAYDEAGNPISDEPSPTDDKAAVEMPQQVSSYAETFSTFTDTRPHGPMSVGMDIHFPNHHHLFGIPEHADSFSLRDTRPNIGDPYRMYNVDIFEYELNSPMSLYGAIPLMIAHSKDHGSFGVLWLNPSETWIDIESQQSHSKNAGVVDVLSNLVKIDNKLSGRLTHWFSETGLIDLWLMPGPNPQTVTSYTAEILGTIPMPPMYSTGFHQCRWNYYSSAEVNQVAKRYDSVEVPLDAIWLDIEYTDGRSKKYFTWDPVAFVNHIQMAQNLSDDGRRLIAIIDPHIKKEDGYSIYEEGKEHDLWIKDASNHPHEAWCWPGASYWPDYLSTKVRDWWASKFDPQHFPGQADTSVDIWNDMNEPSVFNGPEVTAPRDLIHADGWEHRDIHNMYGFLMTDATYNGLAHKRSHLNRPFILTRSFFAGSQRHAAAWTGDNRADWDHLKITVPMLLSLSITGMPFVGADVGGFFNNPESDELVIRWHQAGALQPFFRNHAHHDARHREVYRFTGQTLDLLRNALQLRYSFSPYLYTLFYDSHVTGRPIMRPNWYHEPDDENTLNLEEQYNLGSALLVRPVLEKGVTTVAVYFPGKPGKAAWYDFNHHQLFSGGSGVEYPVDISTIPLFQKAGSIVPRKYRIRKSLELGHEDPITLDIVLDNQSGKSYAKGYYYTDDNLSLAPNNSTSVLTKVEFKDNSIHFLPNAEPNLTHGLVERVVIYNWPIAEHISSISSIMNNGVKMIERQLIYQLDSAKHDGSVRVDIKQPQVPSSKIWSAWKIVINSSN